MKGRRELVFSPLPYIVVYQVMEHAVEIPGIFYGAQDRPVKRPQKFYALRKIAFDAARERITPHAALPPADTSPESVPR